MEQNKISLLYSVKFHDTQLDLDFYYQAENKIGLWLMLTAFEKMQESMLANNSNVIENIFVLCGRDVLKSNTFKGILNCID